MPRQPGVYATFDTTEGTIVVRLFEDEAPITVKNFIELAEGSREWTHPPDSQQEQDSSVRRNHLPPRHSRLHGARRRSHRHWHGRSRLPVPGRDQGLAAQVRQARQAGDGQLRPRNQWLAVLHHRSATPWLTGNHTIFGEVVEGQDIADKITKLPRNRQDKPNKDVVLNSVKIERV